VIQRLETAANQNLDALDAEVKLDKENDQRTSAVLDAIRESQHQLGQIKLNQPSLAAPLGKLQDQLGDEIGSRVMMLRNRIEVNRESLVGMMANQSFQDLTGQALKKIIAFIEGLEMQILQLVQKYRPVLGLNSSKPAPAPAAEPTVEAQNQDQVDSLLADLGF
jgi:chemotaxis regulatin CheY-phosphate phosphatase CheZ